MNVPIAKHRVAFRPNMSLRRPYSGRKQVEVSMYAAGTHADTVPALKTAEIVGNAVATTLDSKLDTSIHIDRPMKTTTIWRNGSRLV